MFLKVCSNMGIVLPMKVPLRGVPHLSEDDKNSARKVRVRVERSSAGVKVFRSARNIYRNLKTDFDKVSLIYDKVYCLKNVGSAKGIKTDSSAWGHA